MRFEDVPKIMSAVKDMAVFSGVVFLIILLLRQCPPAPPEPDLVDENRAERIIDSIALTYDTILIPIYDTIRQIETMTADETYDLFVHYFGEPDTIYQETVIIDTSQLKKCLECAVTLNAKEIELFAADQTIRLLKTDNKDLAKQLNIERKKEKKDGFWTNARQVGEGFLVGVLTIITIQAASK